MKKLENSLLGFEPKAAKAVLYLSLTLVLVLSSTLTAAAEGFGNSGRQVTYGFGDPTEGLQRDAETFGFVGREFPGHVGIDIEAPAGTPIYAAAAGEVTSPGPVTRENANEVVIIGEGPTDSDLFFPTNSCMTSKSLLVIEFVPGNSLAMFPLITMN